MTESAIIEQDIERIVLNVVRWLWDENAELSDRFTGDSLDLISIITELEDQLSIELWTDEYLSALRNRPMAIQDIANVTKALFDKHKARQHGVKSQLHK